MEMYTGTQPNGPHKINNSPNNVLTRLSQPIKGDKRNITIIFVLRFSPLIINC